MLNQSRSSLTSVSSTSPPPEFLVPQQPVVGGGQVAVPLVPSFLSAVPSPIVSSSGITPGVLFVTPPSNVNHSSSSLRQSTMNGGFVESGNSIVDISVDGAVRAAGAALLERQSRDSERANSKMVRKKTSAIWSHCRQVPDALKPHEINVKCNYCSWLTRFSGSTTAAQSHVSKCEVYKTMLRNQLMYVSTSSPSSVSTFQSGMDQSVLEDRSLSLDSCSSSSSSANVFCPVDINGQKLISHNGQQLLLQQLDGSLTVRNTVNNSSTLNVIRGALVEMIIRDELPFSFVENAGFRNFCQLMRPGFTVPSRTTLRRDIFDKVFPHLQKSISAIISQALSSGCVFSTTTDIWTASHMKKAFMVVTLHFIDSEWNLRHLMISFDEVPIPHSGANIAVMYSKALEDFKIPTTQVLAVTMDNASNNLSFSMIIKGKCVFACGGDFFHTRCNGHVVNLIAQDGLKVLKGELDALRTMVKLVSTTPKQVIMFDEMIKTHCRPEVYKLPRPSKDVCTRWNSTLDTIKSSLPYAVVFNAMSGTDENEVQEDPETGELRTVVVRVPTITSSGWDKLCLIKSMMEPLKEATLIVSARKTCSANMVISCIEGIRESIDKVDEHLHSTIEVDAADVMALKFTKYYGDNVRPKQFIIAHILDPRFKLAWAKMQDDNSYNDNYTTSFEHQSSSSSQPNNGSNSLQNYYRRTIVNCFNIYFQPQQVLEDNQQASDNLSSAENSDQQRENNDSQPPAKSFLQNQFRAIKRVTGRSVEPVQQVSVINELERYLDEETVPPTDDPTEFDILNWWKLNACRYPNVAKMARAILAIQASSVASESAFSTGGRIVSDQRSSFKSETVTTLMLAQDWLRSINEYKWKTSSSSYGV